MKKKAALLIDGEWFRIALRNAFSANIQNGVTADLMYKNAVSVIGADEEIQKIFYYDCSPYEGKEKNPISGSSVDFKTLPIFGPRTQFLKEFCSLDHVAMRLGVTKGRGWTLQNSYIKTALGGGNNPPGANDVYFSLEQKGVDMRLGIDIATLALKRLVDRIIIFSGDTDMIPAMKLARREGIQVIMVEVDGKPLAKALDEDCDLVRNLAPKLH